MILINQQCWAQSTTHHLTNNHGERMKDGKFESWWSKCENEIIGTSQAWHREKIWVPNRIQTYDLPNTGRVLHPLELQRTHGEWGHILGSYLTRVVTLLFINSLEGSSQENSQGNWGRGGGGITTSYGIIFVTRRGFQRGMAKPLLSL